MPPSQFQSMKCFGTFCTNTLPRTEQLSARSKPGKGARNPKHEPPTSLGGFLIMKEKKEERKLEARDVKTVHSPQRVYRFRVLAAQVTRSLAPE